MAWHRTSNRMGKHSQPSAHDEQRIRDWQFLVLRFAITRDTVDQAAAASAAQALDAAISRPAPSFTYFSRTTREICKAIAGARDEQSRQALQRFAACIDDARLRAAFLTSLGLQDRSVARTSRPRAAWRDRHDLWRGLPKR
jgi:hypothetical protein